MKRSLLVFLLFTTSAFAQTIKLNVRTCLDFSQFVQFNQDFHEGQFAMFAPLHNSNVNTDIPAYKNLKDKVYKTTFTSDSKANLSGMLYLADKVKKIKALCGLSFACQCTANGCAYDITTYGPQCSISGDGVLSDPYVIKANS